LPRGFVDSFSSASAFDHWREPWVRRRAERQDDEPPPVVAARSWLLTAGLHRTPALGVDESPRAGEG